MKSFIICQECEKKNLIMKFASHAELDKHMNVFHRQVWLANRQIVEDRMIAFRELKTPLVERKYMEYYGQNPENTG